MHELLLAEQVMARARVARRHRPGAVLTQISIEVGEFDGFTEQSVRDAFLAFAADELVGVDLDVRVRPGRGWSLRDLRFAPPG